MDSDEWLLHLREQHLQEAEQDLAERTAKALEADSTPEVLAALAAERDRLAIERDELATDFDQQSEHGNHAADFRDQRASDRDRQTRSRTADGDQGFADRFLSGVDRDDAAGDRADAHDQRARVRSLGAAQPRTDGGLLRVWRPCAMNSNDRSMTSPAYAPRWIVVMSSVMPRAG